MATLSEEAVKQIRGDIDALKQIKQIALAHACELNDSFDKIGIIAHAGIAAREATLKSFRAAGAQDRSVER